MKVQETWIVMVESFHYTEEHTTRRIYPDLTLVHKVHVRLQVLYSFSQKIKILRSKNLYLYLAKFINLGGWSGNSRI